MSFPDDLVDVGDGKDDKENAVNQEKERIGSLLMKQISVRGHKNKSLNEQQRIQQRIKIGLPTKPSVNVSGALFIQNLTSAGYKTYVQTNFKRKECTKYVARESGDICKCGLQERDHKVSLFFMNYFNAFPNIQLYLTRQICFVTQCGPLFSGKVERLTKILQIHHYHNTN